MLMSLSGFSDSRWISCALSRLAIWSSIGVCRKMKQLTSVEAAHQPLIREAGSMQHSREAHAPPKQSTRFHRQRAVASGHRGCARAERSQLRGQRLLAVRHEAAARRKQHVSRALAHQ